MRSVPELLSPAGSLEGVSAAVANGADAVYLGVERFNARDEGAQLTLEELAQACALAHEYHVRIYLTLNTLLKPHELGEALTLLGSAIDRGVDAAIVQDVGLIRLIQRVFPGFEIHGSTQMTVHDALGARLLHELGVRRVVVARENTIDDLRSIRAAVPQMGLEAFVHGALCISYSGQCLMSGMISERSANRGSCAQSCRKDYSLKDAASGRELDRGYLISAKDLAAHDLLPELADLGLSALKIEGRKKRPEYAAVVTRSYREFLDQVAAGGTAPPPPHSVQPLVQIYSRGFTPGMLHGRVGRAYVTRSQPDNRGRELGLVVSREGRELIVDVADPVQTGDGLGFEPPEGVAGTTLGFSVARVRTMWSRNGLTRQGLVTQRHVPPGWRVVRSSQPELLERARASFQGLTRAHRVRKTTLSVRVFGSPGGPLKAVFSIPDSQITVTSEVPLTRATTHALDQERVREHFARLGDTPFALGSVDLAGLAQNLFLPLRELNRLRQKAVGELLAHRSRTEATRIEERSRAIRSAVATLPTIDIPISASEHAPFAHLVAEVHRLADARAAAAAGVNEIVFDLFLRHPTPSVASVRALADELAGVGIALRLRTPTIIRPSERRALDKWLALDSPIQTGHTGLGCELAAQGRDVVLDYAANCFNQHTAAEYFARGMRRVTASVELTLDELAAMVAPWGGKGFEVIAYGRPEGMTIEHCVLSAAFDREPTTCRDLCVQKYPLVTLTDPAGYTFPVATDSDCRNRLLHSRPIEASEFLRGLWKSGVRSYRLLFNLPGDAVPALVHAYRTDLDAILAGKWPSPGEARALVGREFTRGHFARPV